LFKAKDEYAGRKAVCPACRREFVIPTPARPDLTIPAALKRVQVADEDDPRLPNPAPVVRQPALASSAPPNSSAWVEASDAALNAPADERRPLWKEPVVVIIAAVPALMLAFLLGDLAWQSGAGQNSAGPSRLRPATIAASTPARNPKIPVELSYPVIKDYDAPRATVPSLSPNRFVHIRINMKVSEAVLREIALEIKAKETRQYEHTWIYFFLPGKGYEMGPANTSRWASADFESGLRVWIEGLTIEEERHERTAPLESHSETSMRRARMF
jgi:hypothetical protein